MKNVSLITEDFNYVLSEGLVKFVNCLDIHITYTQILHDPLSPM